MLDALKLILKDFYGIVAFYRMPIERFDYKDNKDDRLFSATVVGNSLSTL